MRTRTVAVMAVFAAALALLLAPTAWSQAVDKPLLKMDSRRGSVGEEVSLDLFVTAPQGLQRAELTIRIQDAQIARITGIKERAIKGALVQIVSQTNEVIQLRFLDLDDAVRRGARDVPLVAVTLRGLKAGKTLVSVAVTLFTEDTGARVEPAIEAGQFEAVGSTTAPPPTTPPTTPTPSPSGPPPIGGSPTAPKDLDGDGLYEDIDGDGAFTARDVALFTLALNSKEVQENARCFDFNRDGKVNSEDAFALSLLLESRSASSLRGGTTPTGTGPELVLKLNPIPFGAEAAIPVVLSQAPRGVRSFAIRITLENTKVARIVGVEPRAIDGRFLYTTRHEDGLLEVRGADLREEIRAGALNVALLQVRVQGRSPGKTIVHLEVRQLLDDDGKPLVAAVRDGLLEVLASPVPTLPGANGPPQDLDNDGLYEDVDGDGQLTFADAVLLAFNIDHEAVQANAKLFDFNTDGRADFADAIALAALAEARQSVRGG